MGHVNYPHEPGRLYDCPACEARCHCGPEVARGEATPCIWEGHDCCERALDTDGQSHDGTCDNFDGAPVGQWEVTTPEEVYSTGEETDR